MCPSGVDNPALRGFLSNDRDFLSCSVLPLVSGEEHRRAHGPGARERWPRVGSGEVGEIGSGVSVEAAATLVHRAADADHRGGITTGILPVELHGFPQAELALTIVEVAARARLGQLAGIRGCSCEPSFAVTCADRRGP